MDDQRDVDVVIVGSGVAGLSAALTARQRGAGSVLVAESEGVVGGSSRLSGGLIMGAGTRYQKAHGIDDDADSLFHDYMQLNRWNVDAGVVRRFSELAGPTVEWLGDLGVEYYDTLVFGGEERVPRVHVPLGRGQGVIDVLSRRCREADVDVALGQRVDRLLTESGAVVGVAVGDDAITAGAVVIATGGFGNNPDKLARFFPSAARTGSAWYIGADGSRGDALDFAEQVGAQVVGRDHGLRLLHAGFDRIYEAYLPGWIVLVNRDGQRFVDETAPYGILDSQSREQGDVVYAVFDHATLEVATAAGVARYKHSIPGSTKRQSPHWNADVIAQMVKERRVASAPSIDDLAVELGIPPANLAGTVSRYNADVAAGLDTDYLKDATFLERVATPPFYGVELRPATVASTACGLRIDPTANVRGVDGGGVPGLFAAGECTGSVVGAQYIGSGNNYGNCAVFGRVAGASAAALGAGRAKPMTADSLPVEYLFTLTADVSRAATIADGPIGTRVIVSCAGGSFDGPRIRGVVHGPSGDWVQIANDGALRIDVRLLLRTDDGADILMTYRGIAVDGGATIRAAPTFETGDERYAWLNTVQGVATGSSGGGQATYEVYCLL